MQKTMKTDWPYPHFVAHRGGGSLAPENTLVAIKAAVNHGYTMIECDARLAKDGKIFLLHDDTLERTTNSWGIASQLVWDKLVQLDAGSWYSAAFRHEPLPLLSEVAACCAHYKLAVNIEMKSTIGMEQQTGRDIALAARLLWKEQKIPPLLSSFSREILASAKPELPRGLILSQWDEGWPELTRQLACISLHINYRALNAKRVTLLKAAGLRVMGYTVNGVHQAQELLNWGVDCICTDRIDVIGNQLIID